MSTPATYNGPDATVASPALQEIIASSQETPTRGKGLSTTSLLILCNTLIFFAMLVHSAYILGKAFGDELVFSDFDSALLRAWGSNYGPLTLTGQFWRVVTSIFLHWNFLHLAENMLFLWGLGRYLDRLFNRAQAFAIYLLTGMAGSIFSLAWSPLAISAGASGAIYGQAGVLIALLCFARSNFSRRDIRNLLLWIILLMPIELLWGHVSKRTGYAAHLGGILCGFGIGILLARTFRLSPEEQAARQRRVWQFAAVPLVILFTIVMQVRRNAVMGYAILEYVHAQTPVSSHPSLPSPTPLPSPPPRIARVFLALKGEPKLVHYFSGLLNAELENAGIAVTGSEHDADGVVRGELKGQVESTNLSMGVVKMYINSKRGFQTIDSCRNLSAVGDSNLYEQSAASAVSEIRNRYYDARTIRLEPASDLAASRQFAAEFPSELKKSGLTMVQSGPADIALRIDLRTEKIPVEKDGAAYDIKVGAPNGVLLVENSGSGVFSAKLLGNAPTACPERLADLERIYNTDTLYSTARKITHDLNQQAQSRASIRPRNQNDR
jgi:membrane associated rhomboid family serine protease